jgi:peptidoglycan pentaglycine glycine transferase (the first glycine)
VLRIAQATGPAVHVGEVEQRAEWSALLRSASDANLFQSYEWGEARRQLGWSPRRLAVWRDGRLELVLSVLARRVPWLGVVMDAPGGPIPAPGADVAAALGALVNFLRSTWAPAFVRLAPPGPRLEAALIGQGLVPLPDLWTAWNAPRLRMQLSLDGSDDDLLGRMTKSRRRRITSAARAGVTSSVAHDEAPLAPFLELLEVHARSRGYPIWSRAYFETLVREFARARAVVFVLGWVGGKIASAQLGVRVGPTAYALYAPSSPAARGTGVNEVVAWEWIRWARAGGCEVADFGASGTKLPPSPADLNYGLFRFKVELGCQLVVAPAYYDGVFKPARYRLFRVLERRALARLRWVAAWVQRRARGPVDIPQRPAA